MIGRLILGLIVAIASTTVCGSAQVPAAPSHSKTGPKTVKRTAVKKVAADVAVAVSVAVDGRQIGSVAIDRPPDQSLVALEPLAAALGWTVVRLQGGVRLEGEDRSFSLAIGSRNARENGDLRTLLSEPLVERGGKLYVAATDPVRLFGLRLTRTAGEISYARPEELASDVRISEVARPPTPHPSPTPRHPRSDDSNGALTARGSAGHILVSLDRFGSTHVVGLTGQTQGSFLRTWVTSTGVNQLVGPPVATVNVGTAQHNVTFGMLPDPLSGLIMQGGSYEGASIHNGDDRRDQFYGRRLDLGYTSFGTVTTLTGGGGSDTFAVLTKDGKYDQSVFRRLRTYREAWGQFSREYVAGDRGAAIGFSARTKGRTFAESTVAWASHGLRLGPNDAPISIDLGRELSPATTVVAGFSAAQQEPWSPFVGISTHAGSLTAGFTASNRSLSASIGYQSDRANFQFYSVPGSGSSGFNGNLYLPGATIEAQGSNDQGNAASTLLLRTIHPGLNFIAGVGLPAGGHPGPVAGLSIPLTRNFALETSMQPAAAGPYNLHIALSVSLDARGPRKEPTLPAAIHFSGVSPFPQMRLFVDGVPVRTVSSQTTVVQVTAGTHTFAAESLDGTLGAQETQTKIVAAGDTVSLALWPQRTVSGIVKLDGDARLPIDFTLANLIVLIEPGDVTAEVKADGAFTFPKQPIAPDATIRLDSGSLPLRLRASEPQPIGVGPVELVVRAGLPIERQVFPSK